MLRRRMIDVDPEFPKRGWEGDLFPPQPSPVVKTDGRHFDIAEMLFANRFSLCLKQERFDTEFDQRTNETYRITVPSPQHRVCQRAGIEGYPHRSYTLSRRSTARPGAQ